MAVREVGGTTAPMEASPAAADSVSHRPGRRPRRNVSAPKRRGTALR